MLPQSGDLVDGKYRVVRLIGVGGMGSVYEARHEVLGTAVALKFLDPELAETPGLNERFLQEARVSATVQSPHVARVFDVGRCDGDAYLVMELLSGESLADMLVRAGRLTIDRCVDIALQVLAGLESAHGLGVVHRDLKPDNVFITAGSAQLVKILDFGISKFRQSPEFAQVVTRPGSMMGTPLYMAPEQAIAAEQVDERADIYSVGVIIYEMLTGAFPVADDDPSIIVEQVMMGRSVPIAERDPGLPAALADLVMAALSPKLELRPRTARDLRLLLLPFAGELSPAGRLAAAGPEEGGVIPSFVPRASTVPKTLPPDNPGPPASLLPPPPRGTGTAPPRWEPLPGVQQPMNPPARRRTVVAFALFALCLILIGGGGFALYLGAWSPAVAPAPPLPAPPLVDTSTTELEVPGHRAPRADPRTRMPPRRGTGSTEPGPSDESNAPVGVPLPTIPIPSLPSVWPSVPGLPTTLPPGLGIPAAPATQVAPAGPESESTPAPAPSAAGPNPE